MNDDSTARMPLPQRLDPDPYRHERLLLVCLVVAYLLAGAVVGFALLLMANVVDQITSAPLCRRI